LSAEEGWLTDPDLYAPQHAPGPYADYAGDKTAALWHYDRETAEAAAAFHKNLGQHQALETPTCSWLDAGDGWTFRVESKFLDAMPEKFGGRVVGQKIGHSPKPFVYRCKANEPVEQIGRDTFRVLRPVKTVNVAAFHAGDENYRATVRWGSLSVPNVKGETQTIDFPVVTSLKRGATVGLRAKATLSLPIHYEVDYGPVVVRDGKLHLAALPARPQFPIECRVTAYQIGRRVAPAIQPAPPVSQVFQIVGP
jgi:hypothetical protein